MPVAKRIDGRKLWCVRALNAAIDNLPDDAVKPEREIML
jgi:hypothetical protein